MYKCNIYIDPTFHILSCSALKGPILPLFTLLEMFQRTPKPRPHVLPTPLRSHRKISEGVRHLFPNSQLRNLYSRQFF